MGEIGVITLWWLCSVTTSWWFSTLFLQDSFPLKPLSIAGRDVYFSFIQSITLQQVFCKQGDDPVSQHFCDLLLCQWTYLITQEDYNLLSTCFSRNLSDEEKHTFHDAIHLFPTHADVEDHNHHHLESTHTPVLHFKARHNGGRHAKQATEEQADGLETDLLWLLELG